MSLQEIRDQPEAVSLLRSVGSGKLACPLLLVGPEGVGKRTSVIASAKEVFGTQQHKLLLSGQHPDFIFCTNQGDKSIGIEPIRDLIAEATSMPSLAPWRYLVVDGVDHLTGPAANALLKTLEEPPSKIRFFLLTSSYDRVLPTIRSRCGIVRYRPLSQEFINSILSPLTTDSAKSLVISKLAEGSVGRALQYLGSGSLTLRDQMLNLLKTGLEGDVSSLFSAVDEIKDLDLGLRFLEYLLHDLTVVRHGRDLVFNTDLAAEIDSLRTKIKDDVMGKLLHGIRHLRHLLKTQHVSLAYHLKAYLVTSFR